MRKKPHLMSKKPIKWPKTPGLYACRESNGVAFLLKSERITPVKKLTKTNREGTSQTSFKS
jgi:hypothetical protein